MMLADESVPVEEVLERQEELNRQQQEKIRKLMNDDEIAALEIIGGVGKSHIPWPKFSPPTRSHSTVIRRISD